MRLSGLVLSLVLLIAPTHVFSDPSYFIINQPTKGAQWINGETNYATWTQGVGQGIDAFDVELARLSSDGLLFLARNVPSNAPSLPVMLTDVPPADDYFLLFMNVTHGLMYSMSQRFSILAAGQTASNSSSQKQPSVKKGQQLLATVSLSGSPNPTSSFAYTFAATSGALEVRTMYMIGTALTGLATVFLTTRLL